MGVHEISGEWLVYPLRSRDGMQCIPNARRGFAEVKALGSGNLTALDSVLRPKDSSEVPGFRLERVLS